MLFCIALEKCVRLNCDFFNQMSLLQRWQRCTFLTVAPTSYSASADLYVPKGFKVDFTLSQGTVSVSYLNGTPERKGWLAVLEMPSAACRSVWSCCLIPCQCKGRNKHKHRRNKHDTEGSNGSAGVGIFVAVLFVWGYFF